jgi:hypothetical protein
MGVIMDIDEGNTVPQEPIGTADGAEQVTEPATELKIGPVADPTGDERVDEALARLDELPGTAVADHVEIFDDVRHRLQDVLTSIDQDGPPPSAPPPRP